MKIHTSGGIRWWYDGESFNLNSYLVYDSLSDTMTVSYTKNGNALYLMTNLLSSSSLIKRYHSFNPSLLISNVHVSILLHVSPNYYGCIYFTQSTKIAYYFLGYYITDDTTFNANIYYFTPVNQVYCQRIVLVSN